MSTNESNLLSFSECNAMRGIAILGIILHNYCHWLCVGSPENEYTFSQERADYFWDLLSDPHRYIPIQILSFFGHYGVPIFLFLSSYGLTLKYENQKSEESAWAFIKTHFVKLFAMMIVGVCFYLAVVIYFDGFHGFNRQSLLYQIWLIGNLLPHPNVMIGPYWFFSLLMQLYVIYRLFLFKRHWGITVALIIICTLLQCLCGSRPHRGTMNWMRFNFIGSMLPFGLGLLYARYGFLLNIWQNMIALIVSSIVIIFGSLYFQTWVWIPAFVCIFTIAFVKLTPRMINKVFEWVGSISFAIFVCHPITRKIIIPYFSQDNFYLGVIIYFVITILLSLIFKIIIQKVTEISLRIVSN